MSVDIAILVTRLKNADGGFGPREGQPSESEPTALAALALGDEGARTWLAEHQRDDGSFATVVGPYVNDSTTGMAAPALGPGAERERALDHLESSRAAHVESTAATPIDESAIGWAWTRGTASWVEPTARALWAFRVARPSSTRVEDAANFLRDRECMGGGWNYGNRRGPRGRSAAVRANHRDLAGRFVRSGPRPRGPRPRHAAAYLAGRIRGRLVTGDGARGIPHALCHLRRTGRPDRARAPDRRHLAAGDGVALAWAALALDAPMPGAAA